MRRLLAVLFLVSAPVFGATTGQLIVVQPAAGSSTVLDLGDDGADESAGLLEIATVGDTNAIAKNPSADKLLLDFSIPWLAADIASAGDDALNFFPSGTFEDARISQSSVTQHQAALTITEAQISDLLHTVDTDDQTAVEVPYSPTTPLDWTDPDPINVLEGLDDLASRVTTDEGALTTHAGLPDAHFDHADTLTELNTQIGSSLADGAHTIEVNDLTAAVTWSEVPDVNIPATIARDSELHAENHATRHSLGGADSVTVTNLASGCTDAQVLGGTILGTGVECQADGGAPAGTGTELQYRAGASTLGAVASSSVSGQNITIGDGGNITLAGANAAGEGVVVMTGAASGSYESNMIRLGDNTQGGAFLFGAGTQLSANNGAYFGGRSINYTVLPDQQGILFFSSGNATTGVSDKENQIRLFSGSGGEHYGVLIHKTGKVGVYGTTAANTEPSGNLTVRSGSNAELFWVLDSGETVVGRDLVLSPSTATCASSGDASPGFVVITPTTSTITFTNSDPDGCTASLSESGAVSGQHLKVFIMSNAGGTVDFGDSAGVQETGAGCSLSLHGVAEFDYAIDRWINTNCKTSN